MQFIKTSPKLILLATVVVFLAVGSGCKSKKKAMEVTDTSAADRAKLEQEAALRKQQEEVERRRREAEEQAKRDAEAKTREPYNRLQQYFSAISNAGSVSAANSSINEALALFATADTPVLIVISESAGQKDYDRPTNIKDYLNYLKDQKKQADKIGNLQFDSAGKITEVELTKVK